jgi:DNA polymerase-4
MAGPQQAAILHADLDAFYASVEQLLDPDLRGRPIAVGVGVVLAASYEAKAFGVQGGMSGRRARQLCPTLTFVGGHFTEYQRFGDAAIDVLRDLTPLVERISIDEAFADVRGSVHLFGSPESMATEVRRRVRDEIGLPISVGVATTKHLAKVASQVAKPDGLVVVEAGAEKAFLEPLPVRLLWGVGPKTEEKLVGAGITTIGQLATVRPGAIRSLLGEAVGTKLGSLAVNADHRRVETGRRATSVGAQSALGRRRPTDQVLRTTLGYLADRVASRLRAKDRAGRTITVRVRFADLRSITRSTTLPAPISATLTLTDVAVELARAALADHREEREISLLAISVSHLVTEPVLQLELPLDLPGASRRPGAPAGASRWAIDRSMDRVRERFGRPAVGYGPVALSGEGSAPDAFRRLAEHEDESDETPAPSL